MTTRAIPFPVDTPARREDYFAFFHDVCERFR
jgi:hypothetical protein